MRQLAPEGSTRRRIVAGHWTTAAATRLTGLNDEERVRLKEFCPITRAASSRLSDLLLLFIQGHTPLLLHRS